MIDKFSKWHVILPGLGSLVGMILSSALFVALTGLELQEGVEKFLFIVTFLAVGIASYTYELGQGKHPDRNTDLVLDLIGILVGLGLGLQIVSWLF